MVAGEVHTKGVRVTHYKCSHLKIRSGAGSDQTSIYLSIVKIGSLLNFHLYTEKIQPDAENVAGCQLVMYIFQKAWPVIEDTLVLLLMRSGLPTNPDSDRAVPESRLYLYP